MEKLSQRVFFSMCNSILTVYRDMSSCRATEKHPQRVTWFPSTDQSHSSQNQWKTETEISSRIAKTKLPIQHFPTHWHNKGWYSMTVVRTGSHYKKVCPVMIQTCLQRASEGLKMGPWHQQWLGDYIKRKAHFLKKMFKTPATGMCTDCSSLL